MKNYISYMDRQEVPAEVHEKLLDLEPPKRPSRRELWTALASLAACCTLIVVMWQADMYFSPEGLPITANPSDIPDQASAPVQSASQFAAGYDPLPGETDTVGPDELFVVSSPVEEGVYSFYAMPAVRFRDATGALTADAARAYMPPGSFTVPLTMEDVQNLFWGPEGIPDTYQTEIGRQDLPWALFWDGYTLHGSAWYDGEGKLMELTLYGEKERAGFTLALCQGTLPFTCCIDLDREDYASDAFRTPVTAWSQSYDRDGDGVTDYLCTSEFMTEGDVGVRFESWNNGGIDGEAWFNTLFIRQALSGGLYLDHLATTENIPAWREESFHTLAQARQEADFAPYLPAAEPEGYSAYTGNKEFYGNLSYQEGSQNRLFVRWSRGYDDVEVCVYRDGYRDCNLVDPAQPERYDERLYSIPWCDSVPEEYRETVDHPAFRAEDMSLEIVEARCHEKDTGGLTFSFEVLHPDGTLVSYHCDGLTAQQVWALVEPTL